ncbi:MAG TPA: serine/threonine-protein kinase, partial [Gemmataceae bacterium]|nr:serine/threonine-protein kinase [Gemmataceae bacterium]
MRKIGKYTITRKLGSGGMGVVYAAHDPTANRAVAVKVLADAEADRTDLRRFEREAWAAAQVKHPNTVAVLDAGEADGKPFLVMELVDGQTIGQVVDRRGPLPWVTATKIIISACKGLSAVHAAGLVHRDVKPGNVMISIDGVVKLADFGLAKMANRTTRSLTGVGTIGTPHFMSPEQCHNEPVDGRTDVYALGATFYVLLTNATPYTGDHELQVMYAHCNEPVPDPRDKQPNVPPGCAAVLRKAMAKSPSERYQSATEMEAALERVIQSNGADGDPTAEHAALSLPPQTVADGSVVPRSWLRDSRVTRRRLLLTVPAAGLIGATAAVAWPYFRKKVKEITKPPVPPAILVPSRNVGEPVEAVAVSDDGRWLAVGMADEKGKAGGVKLFDRSK